MRWNMVKLILVRHALTVDNQKSRLSGHIDSSISEEGKEQIDKITNYLKDFDIDIEIKKSLHCYEIMSFKYSIV